MSYIERADENEDPGGEDDDFGDFCDFVGLCSNSNDTNPSNPEITFPEIYKAMGFTDQEVSKIEEDFKLLGEPLQVSQIEEDLGSWENHFKSENRARLGAREDPSSLEIEQDLELLEGPLPVTCGEDELLILSTWTNHQMILQLIIHYSMRSSKVFRCE